jgi:hypothetical protein
MTSGGRHRDRRPGDPDPLQQRRRAAGDRLLSSHGALVVVGAGSRIVPPTEARIPSCISPAAQRWTADGDGLVIGAGVS